MSDAKNGWSEDGMVFTMGEIRAVLQKVDADKWWWGWYAGGLVTSYFLNETERLGVSKEEAARIVEKAVFFSIEHAFTRAQAAKDALDAWKQAQASATTECTCVHYPPDSNSERLWKAYKSDCPLCHGTGKMKQAHAKAAEASDDWRRESAPQCADGSLDIEEWLMEMKERKQSEATEDATGGDAK